MLLILAGVSISMLTGENGILKQATNAETKTGEAGEEESVNLAVLAALTTGNGEITEDKAYEVLRSELKKAGCRNYADIISLPATAVMQYKSYEIDEYGNVTIPPTIDELIESGDAVKKNTTLTADDGLTITIPENFKLSKKSPTKVTEGMIIEDSEANQYVWIPVFSNEEYSWGVDWTATKTAEEAYKNDNSVAKETAYYTAIQTALKNYTATYANSSYTDVWYGTEDSGQYYKDSKGNKVYYSNGDMKETEYNTLYHNMLKSVYKNGGFYIGRYEMGIGVATSANDEGDTTSATSLTRTSMSEYTATSSNESNTAPSIEGMPTPISKANAVGYNYITQSQAQMLAKKLGEGKDYKKVTSSIMFGVQWDAVCVFIEKFDNNNNKKDLDNQSHWLTNSPYNYLWGNYKKSTYTMDRGYYNIFNSNYAFEGWKNAATKSEEASWLCTTGAIDQNSSLNIYDFGGNLGEYTLEGFSISSSPCVLRGGLFSGSTYASARGFSATYRSNYDYSSRASLCIK